MARIRTIKPSFFTSLTIADLTLTQRLTFIGLWTHVDDEGRCIYDPRLIRAALWPLDDRTNADIEDDVRALTEASLIVHYTVRDRAYLQVRTWHEHQRINRKTPSTLPGPEDGQIVPLTSTNEPSVSTHGALTEDVHRERKGREGKGSNSGLRNSLTTGAHEHHPHELETVSPETVFPRNWQPANRHRAYALENNLDLHHEAQMFREHARANGRTAVDWDAAFMTWLGKARPRTRPGTATGTNRAMTALELAAHYEAQEDQDRAAITDRQAAR